MTTTITDPQTGDWQVSEIDAAGAAGRVFRFRRPPIEVLTFVGGSVADHCGCGGRGSAPCAHLRLARRAAGRGERA